MKLVIRIAAALLVALVLVVAAVLVLLPRWLSGETAARHLQAAARDVTGRDIAWRELGVELLPPRVVMHGFEVLEPEGSGDLGLRAERIDLEVAWLPLLARHVVIDSLVLEGVALELLRTDAGIVLPVEFAGTGGRAAPGPEEAPASPPPDDAGFALAVRSFRIVDGRLRLEDRTVVPAVTWELVHLAAELSASALDAPVEFELEGELATGGALRADGSLVLAGPVAFELAVSDLALAPLAPYLGDLELSGVADGRAELAGQAGAPETVSANFELRDGVLVLEDLRAAGPISLSLSVEGLAAPRGRFELDARGAELVYGGAFRKPPGTEAKASGTFSSEPDGELRVDVERMKVKNASGSGSAALGEPLRASGRVAPFELAGWQELVPALAAYAPRGRVGVPEFSYAAPAQLRGRAEIESLAVTPPDRESIAATGAFVAKGDRLESEALTLTSAGQTVPVELIVSELFGGAGGVPQYQLRARVTDAEANELLTAFAALPDTLYGAVQLRADLAGPLGGAAAAAEAVAGTVELRVEPGRLRSVSLLRGVFDQLGSLGEVALALGALRGGSTLQRFYGDDFDELAGTFRLAAGRARTDDLRLIYRDYRVDLKGALGLLDQSLDFTGTLTIDPEIEAALAPDAPADSRRAQVIPLAGVTGTVSQPRVRITQEAALQFVAALQRDSEVQRRRTKLEEKIDAELGAGSGRQVIDALGGLLGLPPAPPNPDAAK